MKCDKCGKEAFFHYRSSINNAVTECHLCPECAKADGFGDMLSQASSAFGGFFGSAPDVPGAFMNPFTAFSGGTLSPMAALPIFAFLPYREQASTKVEEKNADNIPEDAGELFRARRELNKMKNQMAEAVKAEEFEKAAILRDKIREMEK